ncbi:MAG: T9SS type A sorting domain-containing protein [Bacteroidia bacterium]|nr:T9SS type A sorting domain-containing protein [Bacteroidia bacterium]
MKRFFFICSLLAPMWLAAQVSMERSVIGSGGLSGAGGSTFTMGEAATAIGQAGSLQVIGSFQQGNNPVAGLLAVWPGDANDDLIADNVDLLAVGLAYGTTGPARNNGNNIWQAQLSAPWLQSLPSVGNFQHPDCNGDGIINDDDTLAITLNYGLIHLKNGEEDSVGIPLIAAFSQDSTAAGQAIELHISLGTDAIPADMAYGLAFRIELDTTLLQTASTAIDFSGSWLGSKGLNMLTLQQPFTVDDRIHLALTRKDHQNQNGYGKVASIIIMIDDLSGKTNLFENFEVNLVDAVLVDAAGNQIPVVTIGDTLVVTDQTDGIPPALAREIRLYPNPSTGRAELDMGALRGNTVVIRDMRGKEVYRDVGSFFTHQLNLETFAEGAYTIEVQTDLGRWHDVLIRQ